jgi:hypothetical protein
VVRSLAVLLLVVAAAFPDVLFFGRTLSAASYVPGVLPSGPVAAAEPPLPPPVRDLEGAAWVDEPAPYLVQASLAAGRLPLWSAASGLGAPLLGNPNSGALAPLQWVVNLWPSPAVQDLAWITRVLVLGAATWLLAVTLGAGPIGSLVAAAAIMLSGQTLDWIDHHPLNTDAFVPLALAAALGLPGTGRRGVALLALAVAAGLLGLKPQSALVAVCFGLLWLAASGRDTRVARSAASAAPARRLVAWVSGVGLGALLAGIALVPFVETFEHASGLVRAGRTTQSEWVLPRGAWPSLVGAWATAVVPAAVGGDPAGASRPGLPHAGAGVLALAACGAWSARRRRLVWALVLTVALYLARVHGLLPIPLAGVPLLGSVSLVKYCFPLYLALALLAGLGAEAIGRGRRARGWIVAALVVGELLWAARRERPLRVPLYEPAPYVSALRGLRDLRPGRISGPIDLAPPLISGALGFRDLRAIDVLTPGATWETVGGLIAPSQGVTWILADPEPLLAATSPGASLVDLRYVLARGPLQASRLESATRSLVSARRLIRLFSALDGFATRTPELSGGLRDIAGDRRFHWSCVTPCRFRFDMSALPDQFAIGVSAEGAASLSVAVVARDARGARRALHAVVDVPEEPLAWRDLWIARPEDAPDEAGGVPGTIEIEIASPAPRRVLLGGVGPSPGATAEREAIGRELAYRRAALGRLVLRWADSTAHVYENGEAFGAAYFATRVVAVDRSRDLEACVLAHGGERVACVPEGAQPDLAAGETRGGDALVICDADARMAVATDTTDTGLLVFARLFYPGWQARIDGVVAPIVRVNGALIGLAVPPGSHWVELQYRPTSFALGAVMSAVGLIVVVALVAVPSRPRRGAFEGVPGRR